MSEIDEVYRVKDPYFVMFRNEQNQVECHIGGPEDSVEMGLYGILVADLIRHIALAHGADPKEVLWHIILELNNPTCTITRKLDA